jgi:hypothetical protein
MTADVSQDRRVTVLNRGYKVQPIIRPSLRNGFNGVLRALLGDRAFLPPSRAAFVTPNALGLSVGRPGPHDFAVRTGIARRATPLRPSHPALQVRDDREAPLDERGTAGSKPYNSEKRK